MQNVKFSSAVGGTRLNATYTADLTCQASGLFGGEEQLCFEITSDCWERPIVIRKVQERNRCYEVLGLSGNPAGCIFRKRRDWCIAVQGKPTQRLEIISERSWIIFLKVRARSQMGDFVYLFNSGEAFFDDRFPLDFGVALSFFLNSAFSHDKVPR